ncbi:MAG: DinB family protein [Terriglobia bacterium]
MELRIFFLEQLHRETAANRKVLERVPDGKNVWKPHERSMGMGYLAALVASMPAWISMMIDTDELNLDKPEAQRIRAKPQDSTADLLRLADESTAQAQASKTTEGHLAKSWKFMMGGKALSGEPRSAQIADVFTHMAHHRGQLTVYLRLNEAKVPAIYGPSADERFG